MADLSHLLGDVYGNPDGPPVMHEPAAEARMPAVPDWAGDDVLDQAFSSWTPGPPADAPEAERTMLDAGSPTASLPLDDDLAAALSAALATSPASDETVAETVVHETVVNETVEIAAPEAAEPAAFATTPALETEPSEVDHTSFWSPSLEIPHSGLSEISESPFGSVLGETTHDAMLVGDEVDAPVDHVVPTRPWQRSDDDILASRRRRGLRFRR